MSPVASTQLQCCINPLNDGWFALLVKSRRNPQPNATCWLETIVECLLHPRIYFLKALRIEMGVDS